MDKGEVTFGNLPLRPGFPLSFLCLDSDYRLLRVTPSQRRRVAPLRPVTAENAVQLWVIPPIQEARNLPFGIYISEV